MPRVAAARPQPLRRTAATAAVGAAAVAELAPRRRGRPARLSRPVILATALELVDLDGAEALTMRRLGAELGVEAMSLYRHVATKRALLDGVAEQMMAEVDLGRGQSGDWADTARRLLIGIRAVARAHPAAFELVGMRALNTQVAVRPIERLLADLRAGGFSPDRAVAIFRLLGSYVRGYATSEIVGFTLTGRGDDPSRLSARSLPADEFPTIRDLARDLSRDPTEAQFRAGIETIITGLQIEAAAALRPPR
jgi:AcrR family transcriptional regulator